MAGGGIDQTFPKPLFSGSPDEVDGRLAAHAFLVHLRHSIIVSDSTKVTRPATVVISDLYPVVDGGRSPNKAIVDRPFTIWADIVKDGHDVVTAVLKWRREGDDEGPWEQVPMELTENDRWTATCTFPETGLWEFTIEAWGDLFETWRHGFEKKFEVDDPELPLVLKEGALLLDESASLAKKGLDSDTATQLQKIAETMRQLPPEKVADLAMSDDLKYVMQLFPDRSLSTAIDPITVIVEPVVAEFSSWYEFFPRNAFGEADRHSTFRDCLPRLDQAKEMGFDVIYLPPIHPIGMANRKGKNNATMCEPGDFGSPWAIGGEAGGHRSVEPLLGSVADFTWLVSEADKRGLKIAMDFALNCSPDHPFVKEHPDWFNVRPDGSIMYAENPPKKYQDIYPLDFHCQDWRNLWDELIDIVRFWCQKGVTVFRVDNPHTKPVSLWAELITTIKREFPDTIFLSEAFTKPRMMEALAKAGFSQSYTYFTWRVNRQELTEYATELTQTDVRHYFRGNFWPNTPDILAEHLWNAPPAMFKIRAALAATLSSNWGMYSGFEHCENDPADNGKEEYNESEKYEVKPRDWDAPGIRAFITELNRARHENKAMQVYDNLRFYGSSNSQIMCYGRTTEDKTNRIVTIISLDAHSPQEGTVNLPLAELGIDASRPYTARDLVHGDSYTWEGEENFVSLSPSGRILHIFRLEQ